MPEQSTGVGNLDFAFLGSVQDQGIESVSVEFKLAHSKYLYHGVRTQLPEYMDSKNSQFGAYVVLWFKGREFDKPTRSEIAALLKKNEMDWPLPKDDLDFNHFQILASTFKDTLAENIRVFTINVAKQISASKK